MSTLSILRRMAPIWRQKGSGTRFISRMRLFSVFKRRSVTGARRSGIKQNHRAFGCIGRVSCDIYINQEQFQSSVTQHERSATIDEYPDGHYKFDYFFVRIVYQLVAKM